jgi:hypothetical protein
MLQPVIKDPRFQGTMTSMNKTICSVAWKNLDSESINIVFLFWNIDCWTFYCMYIAIAMWTSYTLAVFCCGL